MTDAAAAAEARLDALAAQARRLTSPCGDGAIVWRVWGDGPPLVLLHGAHGDWSHWFHTIGALAPGRSLWIPDLPGSGDSAMPEGEDHAALVDPIARGLVALLPDAGPLDLTGFSFGGIIATHLAARHPALVRRLIVVNPGGLDTPLGNIRLERLKGLTGPALAAAQRANLMTIMLHYEASADALALAIYRRGLERARFNPGHLVMPDHLVTALARCSVPLDAIWGALDGPHPDPALQEAALRRLRPHLRFRIIADAGHWCMYERPGAFNAALRDLLARPTAPGTG